MFYHMFKYHIYEMEGDIDKKYDDNYHSIVYPNLPSTIWMNKIIMKCDICKINKSKYKCPKCRNVKYCSVACCQNHLSSDCTLGNNDISVEISKNVQLYPTEDTIPPEKLNLLCYDDRLKELVSDTYLQSILAKIDNSTSPNEELEKAMIEPIFEEFAKRCLEIVKEENSNLG